MIIVNGISDLGMILVGFRWLNGNVLVFFLVNSCMVSFYLGKLLVLIDLNRLCWWKLLFVFCSFMVLFYMVDCSFSLGC